MKTMKVLSILAIIFSFSQCGTTNFVTKPPFEIDSAEYFGWVGGQPGISGINVKIELKKKSAIDFDSFYFRNKVVKLEVKEAQLLIANYNTSSKTRPDIILHSDSKMEMKNEIPKPDKFPFELKDNEAVISYQLGGKVHYYKISNLKKKDTGSIPKIQ